MLDGYLAFARGDTGEDTVEIDIAAMLKEIASESETSPGGISVAFEGTPTVKVRPQAFKRCVGNLVRNACRHADRRVTIEARHADGILSIGVDDDGPGVPFEEQEAVFKPFYRLDSARNLDTSGTGLGLSIARDIARAHGGDIALDRSPLGGLRATVIIPA
jgi:two-component system osmolarity sensor histidine kinase EnvZ